MTVYSLLGEVFICRKVASETRGDFGVAISTEHLSELLSSQVTRGQDSRRSRADLRWPSRSSHVAPRWRPDGSGVALTACCRAQLTPRPLETNTNPSSLIRIGFPARRTLVHCFGGGKGGSQPEMRAFGCAHAPCRIRARAAPARAALPTPASRSDGRRVVAQLRVPTVRRAPRRDPDGVLGLLAPPDARHRPHAHLPPPLPSPALFRDRGADLRHVSRVR